MSPKNLELLMPEKTNRAHPQEYVWTNTMQPHAPEQNK